MSQTQRVRMNFRPGSRPRLFVCHSRSWGFSEFWPTIGFCTIASLKWSTTAAMANAPPSRSYRLDSVMSRLLDGITHPSECRFDARSYVSTRRASLSFALMPTYQSRGEVPRKRHIQFRDNGSLLTEEVMGLEGFTGNESILYHLISPCRVKELGAFQPIVREEWVPDAHAHRHFKT